MYSNVERCNLGCVIELLSSVDHMAHFAAVQCTTLPRPPSDFFKTELSWRPITVCQLRESLLAAAKLNWRPPVSTGQITQLAYDTAERVCRLHTHEHHTGMWMWLASCASQQHMTSGGSTTMIKIVDRFLLWAR